MVNRLQSLLASGWPELLQEAVAPVLRRWPNLPWRSAYLEVRGQSQDLSYFQVLGLQKEPIARSEFDASTLPVTWVLDEAQVLRRELCVPALSAAQIPALLSHELPRQTPFSAEQVSFAWRIMARDATAGTLRLELWVMPLTAWKKALDQSGIAASRIRRVTVLSAEGPPLPINLLSPSDRARALWPELKRVLLAAAAIVLLLGVALIQIKNNRQSDVAQWQERVAALEQEAVPAREVKAQWLRKQRMQQLLSGLHRESAPRLVLLEQLSRCLPKDVVLDRLSIRGRALSMDGVAKSPEAVIQALACAPIVHSPRLVGTLQADASGRRQRFSLQAELKGAQTP